jgi:hypothetical protein
MKVATFCPPLTISEAVSQVAYPVTLTDNQAINNTSVEPLEDTPRLSGMPKISRADVAAFLLKTTVNRSFIRQTVVLRPFQ